MTNFGFRPFQQSKLQFTLGASFLSRSGIQQNPFQRDALELSEEELLMRMDAKT